MILLRDKDLLRDIEIWTGHRRPPGFLKLLLLALLALLAAARILPNLQSPISNPQSLTPRAECHDLQSHQPPPSFR